VPLAAKRAGLKVVVCDTSTQAFNFNVPQLERICQGNKDILAVIAAHLGGIPLNLQGIEQITRKFGIFLIEDCAQSLGAIYKNKFTGTYGDFSFFSLCRGKGLTIYEGGVAVANNQEYIAPLENKIKELAGNNFFAEGLKMLEFFGYWVFYRPQLFWFVFKLPQGFWNWQGRKFRAAGEEFAENFPLQRVWGIRKALGHASFHRLEEEIAGQRQKAAFYIERLKGMKGLMPLQEGPEMRATYSYLALIFATAKMRRDTLLALEKKGLGGSLIYRAAITDYGYLEGLVSDEAPLAGRQLAERTLSLSTSTFLSEKEQILILDTIAKNIAGR
jgi:dTDP-4-amino-4,6-dideoxygalactose transaminase